MLVESTSHRRAQAEPVFVLRFEHVPMGICLPERKGGLMPVSLLRPALAVALAPSY